MKCSLKNSKIFSKTHDFDLKTQVIGTLEHIGIPKWCFKKACITCHSDENFSTLYSFVLQPVGLSMEWGQRYVPRSWRALSSIILTPPSWGWQEPTCQCPTPRPWSWTAHRRLATLSAQSEKSSTNNKHVKTATIKTDTCMNWLLINHNSYLFTLPINHVITQTLLCSNFEILHLQPSTLQLVV